MAAPAQSPQEQSTPLADSPYRVTARTRRERWWYADGIWLDQGQLGASVGFAWTHWLADRGVELRDGEIGDEYARQLYRAAQRAAGLDATADTGTTVISGAEALKGRGLLQDFYICPDADSVLDALLERGPVVTGLAWHRPMEAPVDVDGWMLCRMDRDSPSRGGHCVLLNGIALDLTLDGVTGFVRFKNSWGTSWGDGGHALLSIDDLTAALQGESILPIPVAGELGAGLRQDVATEGLGYGPAGELYERSAIDSDIWTNRDTVGAVAYARAIARGIQHTQTRPPLTIGIKGAWGAGKTSLMRMIQERLEWPEQDGGSSKPRPIHLSQETRRRIRQHRRRSASDQGELREVTNLAVLRKTRGASSEAPIEQSPNPDGDAGLKAEPVEADTTGQRRSPKRWRPTVWFNPWMYQTGEQIWAGLAHEIITQITDRMSAREREHFWLQLNLKRIDEEAVRRKLYGIVLSRAVPWAIVGVILLVAGLLVLAFGRAEWLGAVLTAAGPTTAVLGTGLTAARVLSSRVSASLSGLVQPVTAAGDQLASTYESVVEHPDYRAESGRLYLVQADVQRVLDLVATPKRPLVIFIDDLDRCSPGSVVQVIEAVNLFLAGAYPNTIFVIAMEPEMVAAHVETVYGDLVHKLEETSGATGQAFELGWRFLEKIVQLPLAVPTMERKRTSALLESLFAPEVAPAESDDEADEPGGPPERVDGLGDASLSETIAIAGDVRPGSAWEKSIRSQVERRLTVDDPEVREVMAYAQRFLRRNPREIKRFVNLFRFFTMIYTERRIARLAAPASLDKVAKLAVLGIRWPSLLSALALAVGDEEELTVFELLENSPSPGSPKARERALKKAIGDAGVSEATTGRLLAPELREFLESEPKVGPVVRGYL